MSILTYAELVTPPDPTYLPAPARLFASGEQGVWYDPSDLSTLFQDAAGTIPVTAVGQPVGRILDKSGRWNHATQATTANKPILQSIGGKLALVFDGVDDFLSTASIDFSSTDKMTVVAGARKLSNAAAGLFLECSANFNNNAGSFVITAPESTSGNYNCGAKGNGGYTGYLTSATTAVSTDVLCIVHDFAGVGRELESPTLRRNGVSDKQGGGVGTFAENTGNFGNYPLYIGRRGGTSLPFNGHLYQLVVRGAATADVAPIESFIADKTGVTLP